ncbi:MAG: hypothetical protein QM737_18935 [Ferruginibacter sp.]
MQFNTFTSLTVIFSVIQLCIVLIPIIFKDKDPQNPQIKYTKKDIWLIIFSILALGLSLYIFFENQDNDAQKENDRKLIEKQYKEELDKKLASRDSIHSVEDSMLNVKYNLRVDSSYQKSIKASNEALAKYNLVLVDSLNRATEKINIKTAAMPQISLTPNEKEGTPNIYLSKEGSEDVLNFRIISMKNIAYNLSLKYCIVKPIGNVKFINSVQVIDCGTLTPQKKFLNENTFFTPYISIKPEWLQIDSSIVFVYGTFSADIDNKKIIQYHEGRLFSFKGNTIAGSVDEVWLGRIEATLKQNNKID